MIYVALNELLPVSKEYGKPSDPIMGVTAGIIVMAISLILMYDTKKIIVNAENCYNPDYINESLSLLLDSINIFSNLFVINDI